MAARCDVCNHALTSEASRRRRMGAKCAARHYRETITDEEQLVSQLETLLAEALESGEDADEVARVLGDVRMVRFIRPDASVEITRLLDWHLVGEGRKYRPIPEHLQQAAWACVNHLVGASLMASLRRRGYGARTRRDAARILAALGAVVPEVLGLFQVTVPADAAVLEWLTTEESTGLPYRATVDLEEGGLTARVV